MGEEMRVKGSEVAEELITAADYDKVMEYVLKGTPPPLPRRSNNNLKILERVALFSLEMIKLHMDEELAGDNINIKRLKTPKKRPIESAADPDPPLLKVCLLADAVPTKKRSPRRPSKDPHDYQEPNSLKKHKYHHPESNSSSNCSDLYEHPPNHASNSPVDVEEEEWHPESISEKEIKRKKKKKKAVSELLNRNPRNPNYPIKGPPAWREIPVFLSEMMERTNGSEIVLVIEKVLTNSDMNKNLSRLQMPESQMNKFLREEEVEYLKMKQGSKMNGIEALLHQQGGGGELSTEVTLRRWEMLKGKNSGGSIVFVLASGWNQVVDSNMLRTGDTIQVWSFRVNNHLHFALLKIH